MENYQNSDGGMFSTSHVNFFKSVILNGKITETIGLRGVPARTLLGQLFFENFEILTNKNFKKYKNLVSNRCLTSVLACKMVWDNAYYI